MVIRLNFKILNFACLLLAGFLSSYANEWDANLNENVEHIGKIRTTPIIITKDNFEDVINEPELGTFVMFQAPWCGHCKRMLSTWNELSQRHNSQKKFFIAKVDCTIDTEFCSDNDILGYPTFIFYKKGDLKGHRYDGQRDFEAMELYMYNQMNPINSGEEKNIQQDEKKEAKKEPVASLTETNFANYISKDFHFVKFFAPWCGHCKMMAATWENLGKKYLNSKVSISEVDCTKQGALCHSNDVRGYPTLIFFHNGQKIESYNRDRTVEAFSEFIDNLVSVLEPKEKADAPAANEAPGVVVALNKNNFQTVLSKPRFVFVKFFSTWSSVDMQTWNELAIQLLNKDQVKIAEVDCTNNVELCMNTNIVSYPTFILYKQGKKVAEYAGSRDLESLLTYVNQHLDNDEL